MKVAFCTLGCKVNQYESQSMEQALIKRGFECVGASEEADVYIVNSCTVTAESDRKTRQNVRHLRKLHHFRAAMGRKVDEAHCFGQGRGIGHG